MKRNYDYDENRPLRRIEVGDIVQIVVITPQIQHRKFSSENTQKICKIPRGHYKAVCISVSPTWKLECKEQPSLSGSYTYWIGNKYHSRKLKKLKELNKEIEK